jgi:hypothetical protein
MKGNLQSQSLVDVLRAAVESWRRANGQSRETVALNVMDAHTRIGADMTTGILFDSSSKDLYTQAKHAAQKLYRWLGGDDEQEAKLPANMMPSILAALPVELRVVALNQILSSLGVEVRAIDSGANTGVDFSAHLRAVMKEASEAQLALVNLPADASDEQLLAAHKELTEASQACERAACDAMATVADRQIARASAPASK